MAFSPVEFYRLADELKRNGTSDDAKIRSSVSRAYYAALIVARDCARLTTRGTDGHKQVIQFFEQQSGPRRPIGTWLRDLSQLRRKADYEPDNQCPERDAGKALALCSKVLVLLDRITNEEVEQLRKRNP